MTREALAVKVSLTVPFRLSSHHPQTRELSELQDRLEADKAASLELLEDRLREEAAEKLERELELALRTQRERMEQEAQRDKERAVEEAVEEVIAYFKSKKIGDLEAQV